VTLLLVFFVSVKRCTSLAERKTQYVLLYIMFLASVFPYGLAFCRPFVVYLALSFVHFVEWYDYDYDAR